ncbi:hypothetical protein BE221DRAFT_116063 [Ostreococcus tauri]|uniref:Uncharacterized protein n=1 Tax=Ostreococcus tauri TaxID=70448 RepID=A0A1Y5I7F7_OSTTA|nr:hypothetical protein BE221DRAFT_116063 [Ostreococcus tauri]
MARGGSALGAPARVGGVARARGGGGRRARGFDRGSDRGARDFARVDAPGRSIEGERAVRARALPQAFEPAWWATQLGTCGVILAAYAATRGRSEDEGDENEECPKCEGSGRAACACTRWSSDGEGCGTCGYTGITACPACRGGGRAVRVTVKIEVPTEEAERAYERDRSGLSAREVNEEARKALSLTMCPAIMDSARARGGSQGQGDDDEPSSSKDDDFYAQSGEAIRILREDYPDMLKREPRWSIYRDNIGLVDETMTFAGPGRDGRGGIMASNKNEYKRVFKIVRIVAAVLFSNSTIEVSRIWSPLGSSGLRTIRVRWAVRGKLRLVSSLGADEARFDGISEYKLDSKGFIYEHKITDLDWDVAALRERVVNMMRAATAQRQPIGSGDW